MSTDFQLKSGGSVLSGALFIAGTSIGAGMLALPFATGIAGFWPSMVVNVLCWLFMLCTGLLFLEATLWMPDGSNVLSMTRRFLGLPGKIIGGVGFIYLYYCLLTAYFSGGVPILVEVVRQLSGIDLDPHLALIAFTVIFGGIIFLGAFVTDRLNYVLMAGLIFSYMGLLGAGAVEVQASLLGKHDWPLAFLAVPTVFSAYGYHNIVPSISTYLGRNHHKLRLAIGIGTLIPFVIYGLWQWVIIGTIPQEILAQTLAKGETISEPLQAYLENPWLATFTRFFGFFAIITSVLGVGLSMVDFMGDGTKIPRKGWGRLLLCCMVFIPPFILSWSMPGIFFDALHYAGVYGEAILNGMIPILMVWVGRYVRGLKSDWQLPGGKPMLAFLFFLTLAIVGFEIIGMF